MIQSKKEAKDTRYVAHFHLRGGSVLSVANLVSVKVCTNTESGKITSIHWQFDPKADQQILDIQVGDVLAVLVEKQ